MAATAERQSSHKLEVRHTYAQPPERLFRAWTTPNDLKRWHAPRDLVVSLAELDVRVGGRYRIHMRQPDGTEHRVSGEYTIVNPPRRLAFTWEWEQSDRASLVTIDFLPWGTGGTELVLTHEDFPTDTERNNHEHGWSSIAEKLAGALADGGR
ncbi:MAG TPA: SRPBCC domain-containing protein [Gemmatimonadales bacterium]|nr:SRPBCC domain-containing protein [Gemmatimonadales bacterium]